MAYHHSPCLFHDITLQWGEGRQREEAGARQGRAFGRTKPLARSHASPSGGHCRLPAALPPFSACDTPVSTCGTRMTLGTLSYHPRWSPFLAPPPTSHHAGATETATLPPHEKHGGGLPNVQHKWPRKQKRTPIVRCF